MTDLFTKPIDAITAAYVAALLEHGPAEGPTIEYKAGLAGTRKGQDPWMMGDSKTVDGTREKIVKEVVAFANAGGGTLVLGIAENKEDPPRPSEILPIPQSTSGTTPDQYTEHGSVDWHGVRSGKGPVDGSGRRIMCGARARQIAACASVVFMLLLVAAGGDATAEMVRANEVASLDEDIRCLWARNRIIFTKSGPCDDFKKPSQIKVGESFEANGKKKVIGIVIAERFDRDIKQMGLRRGEWYCLAAESAADIPSLSGKKDHTGTWIYIAKCQPIK